MSEISSAVTYRTITPADHAIITPFIKQLYIEDPDGQPVTDQKIAKTFAEFSSHPDKGTVVVIERDGVVVGYAILIDFWSNEGGGNVIVVDELYVDAPFRGQGIASTFLRSLVATKYHDLVALQLEVTPGNKNARRLYERLGFKPHKNTVLQWKP